MVLCGIRGLSWPGVVARHSDTRCFGAWRAGSGYKAGATMTNRAYQQCLVRCGSDNFAGGDSLQL